MSRNKNKYVSLVVIRRFARDYLTITTWNRNQFLVIKEEAFSRIAKIKLGGGVVAKQYLQYRGEEMQGVFAGIGVQSGQEHYMLTAKGGYAEILSPIAERVQRQQGGLKCSNIHLQVTSDAVLDLKAVNQFIESPNCLWPSRKLKIRAVLDSGGLDTIYFGSQKGEAYQLIYIKEWGDGERGTRFEARFSRSHAQIVFDHLANSKNQRADICKILRGRWQKLPVDIEHMLINAFREVEMFGEESKGVVVRDEHSMRKRFDWFMLSVSPAVMTLLTSEYADETMKELNILLNYGKAVE